MGFIIVYITCSSDTEAKNIAKSLLEERLIACANIISAIDSLYWWQGNIANDTEHIAIVKTIPSKWETLQQRVEKIHSYDVPCMMKFEVAANSAYEKWIFEQLDEPINTEK